MIFTPAITDPLVSSNSNYIEYYLRLDHGARSVSKVEGEIINALPKGTTYNFHVTSYATQQVNRSIAPEAIALGVFGLIAALAALVIAGRTSRPHTVERRGRLRRVARLGRQPPHRRRRRLERHARRGHRGRVARCSSWASSFRRSVRSDPFAGSIRTVGFGFDWTVLATSFAYFVLVIGGVAVVLALRQSRRFARRRRPLVVPVGSRVASHTREGGSRPDGRRRGALRARARPRPRRRSDSLGPGRRRTCGDRSSSRH